MFGQHKRYTKLGDVKKKSRSLVGTKPVTCCEIPRTQEHCIDVPLKPLKEHVDIQAPGGRGKGRGGFWSV